MSDLEIRCACGLWLDAHDISAEQASIISSRWLTMLGTHRCAGRPLSAPVIRSATSS
jgi:hypothetical protein